LRDKYKCIYPSRLFSTPDQSLSGRVSFNNKFVLSQRVDTVRDVSAAERTSKMVLDRTRVLGMTSSHAPVALFFLRARANPVCLPIGMHERQPRAPALSATPDSCTCPSGSFGRLWCIMALLMQTAVANRVIGSETWLACTKPAAGGAVLTLAA